MQPILTTAKLSRDELSELGLRHVLNTANTVNPIRFHDDLDCVIQAGASVKLIARIMGLRPFTVRHWRHGGMPMDQFSILVVNRWANDVRSRLGQESSP